MIKYNLANCFAPAIVNGDLTGLTDTEENQLDEFLKTLPEGSYLTPSDTDLETNFERCEVTGFMADCVEFNLIQRYTILSIDAWNGPDGWTWNDWYKTGSTAPEEILNWSPRKIFKYLRDEGILGDGSKGEVALEDDQYNLVILERGNRRPLYAIEYGNKI